MGQTNAEDVFGKRIDRCLTDALLKFSGGIAVGTILSLLFLKRRSWPIIMGSGFGVGIAYNSCERSLNSIR
ncbi:MICOS complex subunit Mic10-like [Anopheles nili]|uniref:MICOS complex subunit Mic10-like n=1 Tax=Anopheles nili TaxID=185578 RepID=UPI00237BF4FD|nr:MICOS complex subunit Mic10-like [Anopheles nili]